MSKKYDTYSGNADVSEDVPSISVAIAAGAALAEPHPVGGETDLDIAVPAFVVPEGYRIDIPTLAELDAGRHRPQPRRKKGRVDLEDLDSLIGYVKRHARPGTSVWVNQSSGNIIAVLNDHDAGADDSGAHFRDHRASFSLTHTPEWKAWTGMDGRLVSQLDFAEFVEDQQADIASPDPATMLEIASTFTSKTDVTFNSVTNLKNGAVQVQYHEDVNAKAGKASDMEIPGRFQLALSVYEHGPKYGVSARLRHRCNGGKLLLGFKLDRISDVLRFAIVGDEEHGIVPRLRSELGDIPVYLGSPRD